MLRASHKRLAALAGLVALLVLAAAQVAGLDAGLLHLAPGLVLLGPLLAGRYVGEEHIAALAGRRTARVARAALALRARLPRAPRVTTPRGAGLLAGKLAERGPPRLAHAAT